MYMQYSIGTYTDGKATGSTMVKSRGWLVVLAGMGLNLALGVLYAWSVFSKQLTESVEKGGFGWSKTEATLPYTLAIACFAIMMVPAGRLQDRFGPRVVATCGAVLAGIGIGVTGFSDAGNIVPALVGFGILGGMGLGLGYASATPAAVKWFSPARKGLITGLVVSGFGLAPVYIAPLSRYLLDTYGISKSFWIIGSVFAVVTAVLTQFIVNPPTASSPSAQKAAPAADGTWREMFRNPVFYCLYLEYACAATAGLMIIGHLARIVSAQSNNTITVGYFFVVILALFNAGGRIVAGIISDYLGRENTLSLVYLFQAVLMASFSELTTFAAFIAGSALVGFNYGACLALFPATTADYWGTKNLGLNYGIIFTAWGIGGVFGPILAARIADAHGNYEMAYQISAGLLMVAVALAFITHGGIAKIKNSVQQ